MNEDLNLEKLVDNLDESDIAFYQKTERDSSGTITCSLSFQLPIQDVIRLLLIKTQKK